MSSNPAKHIGIKQQKLIEESIKNYVVYYDKTFSLYLKLRSDILELHNTVRLLSTHKEKRNTSNPDDNETKEEVVQQKKTASARMKSNLTILK